MADLFAELNNTFQYLSAGRNVDGVARADAIDDVDGFGMHVVHLDPKNYEVRSEYISIDEVDCSSVARQLFDEFVYGKPQGLCAFDPSYRDGWAASDAVKHAREVPAHEAPKTIEYSISDIGNFGDLKGKFNFKEYNKHSAGYNCFFGACGWGLTFSEASKRWTKRMQIIEDIELQEPNPYWKNFPQKENHFLPKKDYYNYNQPSYDGGPSMMFGVELGHADSLGTVAKKVGLLAAGVAILHIADSLGRLGDKRQPANTKISASGLQ